MKTLKIAIFRLVWPIIAQESYGGSVGKSMKGIELVFISKGLYRVNEC